MPPRGIWMRHSTAHPHLGRKRTRSARARLTRQRISHPATRITPRIRTTAASMSRRLGREDEESGDLLVGVKGDPRLHVAGLVAQRDVDDGVIADAPDERFALAEALERTHQASDRGQGIA